MGVGHTHAHVLREWQAHPPAGASLTCVSDDAAAVYSGMLPGVLAGDYAPAAMEIDLTRLCASAGADLVIARVAGLDVGTRHLHFEDRPPLPFDMLSIGVGSVPSFDGVDVADAERTVPIKPMQTFLPRLDARLREAKRERGSRPLRMVTVGGGAGGVEVTLCLPFHVGVVLGAGVRVEQTILAGSQSLLPGSATSAVARVERVLRRRGVRFVAGRRVTRVDGSRLDLDDGTPIESDVTVWATGAVAPPVLSRMGLPTGADGFLLTSATLQSTGGAPVFAVGDTGSIVGERTPKAGVYAVRQGPVLWDNLQRALDGRPLRRFEPQRHFLRLLNVGEGCAIGEWRGVSFEGAWCRRLKDFIDVRFVARYRPS